MSVKYYKQTRVKDDQADFLISASDFSGVDTVHQIKNECVSPFFIC